MSVFNENAIIGSAAAGGGAVYDIPYSCRFDHDATAILTQGSFQPGSAYTVSLWIKRATLGVAQNIYRINSADYMAFNGSDQIEVERRTGSLTTTQKFRDTSAWYHIHLKSTSSVFTLYVNGVQVATNTSASNPYSAGNFTIGTSGASSYLDGYLAEFHWIDGSSLDPDSFAEEDATYGHWKPKEYTGSHGTNGFYLDFSDPAALGADAAGSNNFTPSNLAVHDQVPDSPTNNWCTFNKNDQQDRSATFKNGNLYREGVSSFNGCGTGSLMSRNKMYYEVYIHSRTNNYISMGFATDDQQSSRHYQVGGPSLPGKSGYHGVSFSPDYGGVIYDGVTANAASHTFVVGDVIMLALDPASGKFWYGINGVWKDSGGGNTGNPSAGTNQVATLANNDHSFTGNAGAYSISSAVIVNFGQDSSFAGFKSGSAAAPDSNDYGSFYYTPPTGFLALCSKNLEEGQYAVNPKENFKTLLLSGDGGTNRTVTGVGFQPDLVWGKQRNSGRSHGLFDSVRGIGERLRSDHNGAEIYHATEMLRSFDSDGFHMGNDASFNASGGTYVYYNWKAGNATLGTGAFTQGTIPSTCSRNVDAGFSIVSHTGTGAAGTIGHGLSKFPEVIITKTRDSNNSWSVGFGPYPDKAHDPSSWGGMNFTDQLVLDTTAAFTDGSGYYNDTRPTADVFSVGYSDSTNRGSDEYISYCFHSVEGFSKFGTYRGNSQDDGGFVYCGFTPSLIIVKSITTGGSNWWMFDSERTGAVGFRPDTLQAEDSGVSYNGKKIVDILSNGFKFRNSSYGDVNGTEPRLYMAWAKTPFKYANAR